MCLAGTRLHPLSSQYCKNTTLGCPHPLVFFLVFAFYFTISSSFLQPGFRPQFTNSVTLQIHCFKDEDNLLLAFMTSPHTGCQSTARATFYLNGLSDSSFSWLLNKGRLGGSVLGHCLSGFHLVHGFKYHPRKKGMTSFFLYLLSFCFVQTILPCLYYTNNLLTLFWFSPFSTEQPEASFINLNPLCSSFWASNSPVFPTCNTLGGRVLPPWFGSPRLPLTQACSLLYPMAWFPSRSSFCPWHSWLISAGHSSLVYIPFP